MCGIAGFAGPHSSRHEALTQTIGRMITSLAHRGPDDEGTWVDDTVPVALGHRRLSILDLSAEGHQPMVSASGRYVITYNGEIYNYREIRQELAGSCEFRGGSDTEVMLEAFERYGVEEALKHFNGMFAFGLWDRKLRNLYLACDRFGEKPLYYGLIGRRLVFGSELKALRSHEGFSSEIDGAALARFLNHGYVLAPQSIFASVRKLSPGTWLTAHVEDGMTSLPDAQVWWSAKETALRCSGRKMRISPEDAADQLETLLEDSIRLRSVADVPLGAFLSGGVDSSLIVALMQRNSSRKVQTFTIGMGNPAYNEAIYAAAVARHLGVDHHELYVTPEDGLAVIQRLPAMYDEPFADSSQIPTFLVSQFARSQVTVSLSGDAGDELFGGYQRYFSSELTWGKMQLIPEWCRQAAARSLTAVSPAAWDYVARGARGILPASMAQTALGDKVQKLAAMIGVESRSAVYRQSLTFWPGAVPSALNTGAAELPHWDFAPTDNRFLDWMRLVDTVSYLPGDILCKVDRAAMAVGLESRIPFLDPRVFEFAWSLPTDLLVREGAGKWLLRKILYRHVPRELIERPKIGFAVPIDDWLRGPLKDWASSMLNEKTLREDGLVEPGPVLKRWDEHLNGGRNWSASLWCVLMLEAWLHSGT
jgi:asparagine synthase (glutamine-hydrolysing)